MKYLLFFTLLFLTGCCNCDNPPTKCKDIFKYGDAVEVMEGNYRGYIGYCAKTDDTLYEEGLRLIVFRINPQGKPISEVKHINFCHLTKTAKFYFYNIPE